MSTNAWAMVFDGPGRPLRRVDVPAPEPAAGEMLVCVLACTLCGSDLHTAAGRRVVSCPTVLGHEILGVIEALPTAGLAHLTLPIERWADLADTIRGDLIVVISPKELTCAEASDQPGQGLSA